MTTEFRNLFSAKPEAASWEMDFDKEGCYSKSSGKEAVSESNLEDALLDNLHEFLMELGHGFCLEARQKSIVIGKTRGFVDLVFYHRILKCHVLVELKVDKFTHEHLGQLNTYVSWHRKHMMTDRLAIEELEAWYFGDTEALVRAYPQLPAFVGSKAQYRNPDAIAGGTWEALERILKRAGYYPGGIPKVETARRISKYMDPHRNRSKSFQVFRDALHELA